MVGGGIQITCTTQKEPCYPNKSREREKVSARACVRVEGLVGNTRYTAVGASSVDRRRARIATDMTALFFYCAGIRGAFVTHSVDRDKSTASEAVASRIE